jgi:hypothetical protein
LTITGLTHGPMARERFCGSTTNSSRRNSRMPALRSSLMRPASREMSKIV